MVSERRRATVGAKEATNEGLRFYIIVIQFQKPKKTWCTSKWGTWGTWGTVRYKVRYKIFSIFRTSPQEKQRILINNIIFFMITTLLYTLWMKDIHFTQRIYTLLHFTLLHRHHYTCLHFTYTRLHHHHSIIYTFATLVYTCLHMFTFAYTCLHLFTLVYTCLHLSTFVYVWLHLSVPLF